MDVDNSAYVMEFVGYFDVKINPSKIFCALNKEIRRIICLKISEKAGEQFCL